jgi:uncharacterized protein involved in outer membrane biogenesis
MKKIIFVFLLLFATAYIFCQFFAIKFLTDIVSQALGAPVSVSRIHLKLFPAELGVYDLQVKKFQDFKEPVILSIPEIFLRFDLRDLLKNTLHIKRIALNIEQVAVEKSANGKINLNELLKNTKKPEKTVLQPAPTAPSTQKSPKSQKSPAMKVVIGEAVVSLSKVYYVEYGPSGRTEKSLNFNIHDTVLHNVTDLRSLSQQIIELILKKLGLMALGAQLDRLGANLGQEASQLLDNAKKSISGVFQ